jgi:hypothetical protein
MRVNHHERGWLPSVNEPCCDGGEVLTRRSAWRCLRLVGDRECLAEGDREKLAFEMGHALPQADELDVLAKALRVIPELLMPPVAEPADGEPA